MGLGKRLTGMFLTAAVLLAGMVPAMAAGKSVEGKCWGVYSEEEAAILLASKQDNAHILKAKTKYTVTFNYFLRDKHTSIKWGFGVLPKGADAGPVAYYEWDPRTLEYRWSAEDLNSVTAEGDWIDDEVLTMSFTFRTADTDAYFRVTNATGVADAVIDNLTVSAEGHSYSEDFEGCAGTGDAIVTANATVSLVTHGSAPSPTTKASTTRAPATDPKGTTTTRKPAGDTTTAGTKETGDTNVSQTNSGSTDTTATDSPTTAVSEATTLSIGADTDKTTAAGSNPTVEQPRSSSALPWIIGGVVLVVLAGGGTALWLVLKKKKQGTSISE